MSFCPQCAVPYESPARFCGVCGAALPEDRAPSPRSAELTGPGAAAPEEEDRWVGKVVDHRYRVLERIGVGGMGLVYKVEHIHLAKIAAMKVLHQDTARDAEAVRRFRIEAQAVSRLDHPNIVQTFDFGQAEGALYLVMEYLKGEDLAAIVKREGPLPFDRTARLFVQVCSALTDAHDAGVIHRDLKPENIVVVQRRDGTEAAKVLDFGLAKLRERSDSLGVTSGNQVIGTPYYMSPEQVRSEPLDLRTDIYSLGATLYRVLTGTPPFQATTPMGVLTKHVTDPLELPRLRAPTLNLPAAVDAIVSRAMAKLRDDRYANAAEVGRDLQAALTASPRSSALARTSPTVKEGPRPFPGRSAHPPVADDEERDDANDALSSPEDERDRDAARNDASSDIEAGTGADRLRRKEFDAYERSLWRRRRLGALAVPLTLVAAAAFAAFALTHNKEKAGPAEREPNDTPAQATLLPLDKPVSGHVGKRLAANAPDLDYFRIPGAPEPRVVSVRLEGVPDVDLVLELFDAQGVAVAKSDARGKGGGEWIQPTLVGPGEAFVLVRQLWTQDAPLAEDVPDAYQLSAHFGPPQVGWESEPNDTPATANPVATDGHRVRGYLGRADDRDWYAFTFLSPGKYAARVEATAGVEVALAFSDDVTSDGSVGRVKGQAHAAPADQLTFEVRSGKPCFVGVARRLEGDSEAKGGKGKPVEPSDPKARPPSGLDDPYELFVEPAP